MLTFQEFVPGCVRASEFAPYRLVFADGSSRYATEDEIRQAQLNADGRKTADDQQRAGIDEAKRAYARLQTIIDNADTATTVQLRAAIKEIARDVQHLIRAAVR